MSHLGAQSSLFQSSSRQEALEVAAKMVDHHINMDNTFPQLLELLSTSGGEMIPGVSGLKDQDYPSLGEMSAGLRALTRLSSVKRVPLPAELVEQFGHMQSNCQMGLFPELGRAWLTIDSDIFVWTYEDGDDLAYFDGLSETILSVGLVKPRVGIFNSHIQYLLCLTTSLETVLLGVSFSRRQEGSPRYEEMHLLPEPLFSLPTDNIYMSTIMGTPDGRIFMGGRDGCVYELAYQAEGGWFSRKCRKINHSSSAFSFLVPSFINLTFSEKDPIVQLEVDGSRQILYSRSEKGTLQVFDLGADGRGMCRVISLSHNSIMNQASAIARTIDRSNFQHLVHISAVELMESIHINLVAVTQTGVRLYFTTTTPTHPLARPFGLTLLHVRLPPGFSATAPQQRPLHVHLSSYRRGTTLLASSHTDDRDTIWALSNDCFPFQAHLTETYVTVDIDGVAWALAEVPVPQHPKPYCNLIVNNVLVPTETPLVVSQHMELPRKFVLLSAQGSHIVTKPRPVDQLHAVLLENNGPDNDAVKSFFVLLKEPQACATCLVLACSHVIQDKQVAEWATRAFFLYGGEPHISFPTAMPAAQSPTPLSQTVGGLSSTPIPGFSSNLPTALPYSPVITPSQTYTVSSEHSQSTPSVQPAPTGPEIIYSGKHSGLYLYFSRILRPIWTLKATSDFTVNTPQGLMEFVGSSVSGNELGSYLEQLEALKEFMQKNAYLSPPFGSDSINITQNLPQRVLNYLRPDTFTPGEVTQMQQQLQKKTQAEAQLQEHASLLHLQQLVNYSCEVLGLWRVLCEHQFHLVVTLLSKDMQNQLRMMTFRDFILAGKEVASSLVNALIARYLDDNAKTDAVSQRLREVCPSVFRNEDAISSKAHEMLLNAKNIHNRKEREIVLRDALQLCKQICHQLNLPAITALFEAVHYYHGIVDLCLAAANRRDVQNLALHYYKNKEPPEDQQGFQAYSRRMDCYKMVMVVLGHLLELGTSHPQAPSIPRVPGPPPPRDPSLLTPEEAKNYAEQVFQMAVQSEDELFHVALYDWLIEHRQTERLLQIKSPFVENYLTRRASCHPEVVAPMDLMWQHYEKNNNYSAAARILVKLADRHGTDINLQQRLEYLSRAIMCVKSSEIRAVATSEGEFMHELEEKMEVARIQLKVLEALQQEVQTPSVQEAIGKLNADLIDITQLYEDFAAPLNLTECQLNIIYCAGHYDPVLIENLWKNIIDKDLASTTSNAPQTLSNKLRALSTQFLRSQKYFPLSFLIKYLEYRTCTMGFEVDWVFNTFLDIGVSLPQLLDHYHKNYKARDNCWQQIRQPYHILRVIAHLLKKYIANPALVAQGERRACTTWCLDAVAGYLVDLQAAVIKDTLANTLQTQFKSIQSELERIQ